MDVVSGSAVQNRKEENLVHFLSFVRAYITDVHSRFDLFESPFTFFLGFS